MPRKKKEDPTLRFADMLSALGSESRLRIVRLLLAAHPEGLIAGSIQAELGIAPSTLSHHLEKLRHEGLIVSRREGTFLWYSVNLDGLQELVNFLYAECCTRSSAAGTGQSLVNVCH
ncbi:MAG: metalloregulator ArsR/SmtB family transcription factor [Bryobacterales bacterium]|jgi:DNA-binding transcriptional ArsR family regulator|nr:metalloregulator ArsR/SmtB family transcription factor [Bryobacterales bacterium]